MRFVSLKEGIIRVGRLLLIPVSRFMGRKEEFAVLAQKAFSGNGRGFFLPQ